jgi:hypothetical protein
MLMHKHFFSWKWVSEWNVAKKMLILNLKCWLFNSVEPILNCRNIRQYFFIFFAIDIWIEILFNFKWHLMNFFKGDVCQEWVTIIQIDALSRVSLTITDLYIYFLLSSTSAINQHLFYNDIIYNNKKKLSF